MNKSVWGAAVLLAAGASAWAQAQAQAQAPAQAQVTVWGIVDVNVHVVRNEGFGHRKSVSQGGMNPSRLGFRGVEDLGGGYTAAFWLEGGIDADTGGNGFNFARESHVTLGGPFGKLRLGRDYTPTFWQTTAPFEPFGNNGLGSSVNIARFNLGSSHVGGAALQQPSSLRASNSVSYFLPSLNGVYGQAMVSAPEGVANGKYVGARVGYAKGALNAAAGIGRQRVDFAGGDWTVQNVAATYDFGAARAMAQYNRDRLETAVATGTETRWLIGTVVPVGTGEIRASYVSSDLADSDNDATQLALGYVHFLSKRTALYGTAARITNKGTAQFSLTGGSATVPANASPGGPVSGGSSSGMEIGIRHLF